MIDGVHQSGRKAATLFAAPWFALACFGAFLIYQYLPIPSGHATAVAACLLIGAVGTIAVYSIVKRSWARKWFRMSLIGCAVFVVVSITVSVFLQRITYATFGFTVYGLIPVPALDLTVDQNGVMWFREKSHQINRAELERLMTEEVEILVVGNGWDSVAQLTEEAKDLKNIVDLRILPTPDAIDLFNQLKSEGRVVVLLAHSTC